MKTSMILPRWYHRGFPLYQYFSPYPRTVRQFNLDEFQLSPFLGINIITVPVKKGSRWYGWLTAEVGSCKNDSITYFKDVIYNSILDDKVNTCGIIDIHNIEVTFYNDHIHALHDIPNRYIYGYLISSEATIHNMILQNICLLLIWGDVK